MVGASTVGHVFSSLEECLRKLSDTMHLISLEHVMPTIKPIAHNLKETKL
jgi:hypothetical protein